MAMLLPRCITFIVLIFLWTNGAEAQDQKDAGEADDSPTTCVIPPGMYDGYVIDSYNDEPKSGSLCKVNALVQRIVKTCLPRWCCSTPCNCHTANATKSRRDIPCTTIQCYDQQNILTNYTYVCCPGYTRSGNACVPPDLCRDNSLRCQYSCNTSNGSSRCTCPIGFQLNPLDNRTCQDINECSLSPSPCGDICTNTNGSYTCSCDLGRQLAPDGLNCIDINECTLPSNPCQDVCINTDGSYKCSCSSGRVLSPDGHTCIDINECTLPSNPCQDICINTDSSYKCSCTSSRVLAPDGHACIAMTVPSSEAPLVLPVNDISVQTTAQIVAGGTSLLFQHIVAIVVGSVLFLLLLLFLILFLVCRTRRKPTVDVFVIGKNVEADKKVDFDPYEKPVICLYDEKLESDYSSLKGWKDVPLTDDKESDKDLVAKGTRAQPNIYSELGSGQPAVPPRKIHVVKLSDLNSDYAEITA